MRNRDRVTNVLRYGPYTVTEVSNITGIDRSQVSGLLRSLCHYGLAQYRKLKKPHGWEFQYSLTTATRG